MGELKKVVVTRSWNLTKGIVEVIGTLLLEENLWADGYEMNVPACEIIIKIMAEGRDQGSWIQDLPERFKDRVPKEYIYLCGKLPMTQEHKDIVDSVRAELEIHPAWVAKQAQIAKNAADRKADEAGHRVGWCNKCESYCFGDCEA